MAFHGLFFSCCGSLGFFLYVPLLGYLHILACIPLASLATCIVFAILYTKVSKVRRRTKHHWNTFVPPPIRRFALELSILSCKDVATILAVTFGLFLVVLFIVRHFVFKPSGAITDAAFGVQIVEGLVSPSEIQDIMYDVYDQRALWSLRGGPVAFATLGAASYLDWDDESYRSWIAEINPILESKFGFLYNRLRSILAALLNCPENEVVYSPKELALPGFHLFLPSIFMFAFPHVDLQYAKRVSALHGCTKTLSITLSLDGPGAGLHVYTSGFVNVSVQAVNPQFRYGTEPPHLTSRPLGQPYRLQPAPTVGSGEVFVDYVPGSLYVHTGHLSHRVGLGWPTLGHPRATLQSHASFCDGQWVVYW